MKAKDLVWLHGEVKTPPFSREGRIAAGVLLRRLQMGEVIAMPHSRPMPIIGARCHELRISDNALAWRIIYRNDTDAIIVAEVFAKKSKTTPKAAINAAKRRLAEYDAVTGG